MNSTERSVGSGFIGSNVCKQFVENGLQLLI